MNKHKFSKQLSVCITAMAMIFSACEKKDDVQTARTYYGPEMQVGSGSAKSWITLYEAGNPYSLGLI